MVAAEKGNFLFVGRSGMTYSKQIYCSDVDAAVVNFDGGAGASATSPAYWTPPEPVVLTDVSITTGLTATKSIQVIRGGTPTGDYLDCVLHVSTNPMRPPLRIPFMAGQQVSAIQRA